MFHVFQLREQPYVYDKHLELIDLLRKAGELEQAREAREHMNKSFPLAPGKATSIFYLLISNCSHQLNSLFVMANCPAGD